MFAVAVNSDGSLEIVDIPRPRPGAYEAVVRVEVAYICNGTDSDIIAGDLPEVAGYPALFGHENAGTVVEVGDKARSYKVGDRVAGTLLLESTDDRFATGFGGFCEFTIATDFASMLEDGVIEDTPGRDIVFKIMRTVPTDIPIEAAGLLCMWREILGGMRDMQLDTVDRVLVFGGGPIGLSFVHLFSLLGASAIGLVDRHPEKRKLAVELGATMTFDRDDPALDRLRRVDGASPIQAVVDAVGKQDIVHQALPLLPEEGMLCVYGLYGAGDVRFNVNDAPRNWQLHFHQWPLRDGEAAAQDTLVDWIRSGRLKWERFISSRYPVADVARGVDDVRGRKAIKVLLEYPEA